ncbi:MAG: DUF2961 domain-containing protein [Planctomycetes bacterium]|nr:DUF2961 domain-containing protein [Planctomycetota bacterium]
MISAEMRAKARQIAAEHPAPSQEELAAATAVAGRMIPGDDVVDRIFGRPPAPAAALQAGETATLAGIKGPGVIRHIWMTVRPEALRSCVLRFYWDGREAAGVEAPLGDFFALGHGLRTRVVSLPVAVCPSGGMNSYWPMPFSKHARITITNEYHEDHGGFFYQVDYALAAVPPGAAYFHAQFRRSLTARKRPEHVILDGVRGRGHYVGTYVAWTQLAGGWWGEGEVKFYIDGDKQHPTYCGTGTEDYFGGAWCFHSPEGVEEPFSTPFLGLPLSDRGPGRPPRHGLYRRHIMDPIHFRKDLRVTIQALGWWPGGKFQPLTDDIASTAFWYQAPPAAPFPKFPTLNERFPR